VSFKKTLELTLQKLAVNQTLTNYLEQYQTDGKTASYILNIAFLDGNIEGKSIIDMGTGNGIFAIGAKLLGAREVTAIDIDQRQIDISKENAKNLDLDINFLNCNVNDVNGHYDTCIMNPPFGSVKAHSDIPFIEKACSISEKVYAIHNYKTKEFVLKQYSERGMSELTWEKIKIGINRTYSHHTKDRAFIDSLFIRAYK
jgi:putative methylase